LFQWESRTAELGDKARVSSEPKQAVTCPEKARISEELSAAMAGILALSNREMEAAVACKLALLESIRADLLQARERKDALQSAYTSHEQEHGC
jgi:hypothetical protein